MIEQIVLEHLAGALDVPVHDEVPPAPPASFVVVDKTGSGRENFILSATFAVQSYAPTKYAAAALNEQTKEAMDRLIELDEIISSSLNSDYPFPDTSTKQYRYQAVYNLQHY